MRVIPPEEVSALRALLERRLERPVEVDLQVQAGVPGRDHALLDEVAGLSDRIRLRVRRGDAEPGPVIELRGRARGRVRFLGVPSGFGVAGLLASMGEVASGRTDLADTTRAALATLPADVRIQVFVTATCPFCGGVARLAHQMAVEAPRVTADVVHAPDFPALSARHRVTGVPLVVINDRLRRVGALGEAELLTAVREAVR